MNLSNGAELISYKKNIKDKTKRIVLAQNTTGEFVTWQQDSNLPVEQAYSYMGHYFGRSQKGRERAIEDFWKRVKR
jgi:hypothetical protein